MELASHNPSGTYNFQMASRFLENMYTADLMYSLQILSPMQIMKPHYYKNGDP
jgi:hypothetical protein